MDGFKNSTRTQYMKGGSCEGYAKGGSVKGAAKISKVMGEFKAGTLHSGSKKGPEVTSKKQATAIALSEARKAGAKIPMKKAMGGSAEADDVMMARMSKDELAMGAKGLKMAQERMARDKTKSMGQTTDSETQMLRKLTKKLPAMMPGVVTESERRLMMDAARKKGVPVAPKRPLVEKAGGIRGIYGSALTDRENQTIKNALGYKKGGLSAMPKGKC